MNQGIEVSSQTIDIVPDELSDVSFEVRGLPGACLDEAMAAPSTVYDELTNSQDPSRVGPFIFAEMRLEVIYTSKIDDLSGGNDKSTAVRVDSQKLDLVGYIIPGSLITPSCDTLEIRAVSSAPRLPGYYEVSGMTRCLRLTNTTRYDMAYKIESLACRRPGLKLMIPKRLGSESAWKRSMYDTIDVAIDKVSGVIAAGSFVYLNMSVIAGHTAGVDLSLQESSKLSPRILARIPITIMSKGFPRHPPALVELTIVGDIDLPFMRTRPVTELKRQKQERDDRMETVNDDQRGALIVKRESNIRIRGVTHTPATGAYEIGLGVHSKRDEYIEWLMKIENGFMQGDFVYEVYTANPANDESWMTLGHSFGVVPPSTFSAVMLYFSRFNIGVFHTTLYVKNALTSEILYRISVSIEIVGESNGRA